MQQLKNKGMLALIYFSDTFYLVVPKRSPLPHSVDKPTEYPLRSYISKGLMSGLPSVVRLISYFATDNKLSASDIVKSLWCAVFDIPGIMLGHRYVHAR